MEFQAEQVTSHILSGLTNRSIRLVGKPVVRSLDLKRFLYMPMMLKGVCMSPFPGGLSALSTSGRYFHQQNPLQLHIACNWGCFRNQLPRRSTMSGPRVKSALGLLDGLIRLCVQARRLYYAKLSTCSTKEFGAGNLPAVMCML